MAKEAFEVTGTEVKAVRLSSEYLTIRIDKEEYEAILRNTVFGRKYLVERNPKTRSNTPPVTVKIDAKVAFFT
ncbi:TPA: hypothetical protein EYP70_03430 [Candidatus Bathyarchaeota archaeon]|nr:hypothetical protein [Candidatus Bathyarchaeota archaeon]